jgi:hypothetical protein
MLRSSRKVKSTSVAIDSKIDLGEMQNAFPPLGSIHVPQNLEGAFKVIAINESKSLVTVLYSVNDLSYDLHIDMFDLLFSKLGND